LGLFCGYLPSIMFDFIIDKVMQRNILFKMCVAECGKLLSFILILSLIFKFLPIEPLIFIISVIVFLIMNFIKNLLRLIM
jgi:hypothetical protein